MSRQKKSVNEKKKKGKKKEKNSNETRTFGVFRSKGIIVERSKGRKNGGMTERGKKVLLYFIHF